MPVDRERCLGQPLRERLLEAALSALSELDAQPHAAAGVHRLAGAADAIGAVSLLNAVRQFEASPTPTGVRSLRAALEAVRWQAGSPPPQRPPPTPPHAVDDDACALCLDPLRGARAQLQLSCTHRFHAECIVRSACCGHHSCPLCRATIGTVRVVGGEELVPTKLRGVGLSADTVWRDLYAHTFAALGAPDATCLASTTDDALAGAVMGRSDGGSSKADIVLLDSSVGGKGAGAIAASLRTSGFDGLVCVLTALPQANRAALLRASPDLDLVLPKGSVLDALAARLRLALAAKRLGLPLDDTDAGADAAGANKRVTSLLHRLPSDVLARLLTWLPLRDRLRVGQVCARYARCILHAAPLWTVCRCSTWDIYAAASSQASSRATRRWPRSPRASRQPVWPQAVSRAARTRSWAQLLLLVRASSL